MGSTPSSSVQQSEHFVADLEKAGCVNAFEPAMYCCFCLSVKQIYAY